MTSTVCAIIVSWNDWAKIFACLESLHAQKGPDIEIIVIDNNSQDGTAEHIAERFPQVRLIHNATNIGHTMAVNQGFTLASGKYVLVLDSDTEINADCVRLLTDFLEQRPNAAMVAPRTFNTDGSVQESARDFPSMMSGLLGRQSLLTRLFPNNAFSKQYLARDFIDATEPFKVQQVGGACMFFRRELLDIVGPWDKRYLGYFVDTDWCHTIHSAGLGIYCLPAAKIIHHEGNARLKQKTPARIVNFNSGAYQYYTKWNTYGSWDPRSIFAGTMLLGRAFIQILANALPSGDSTPQTQQIYKGSER
jgi:N-acetylglucosaminyl-diphospho-decaprenol L-rhamnosyltransferase